VGGTVVKDHALEYRVVDAQNSVFDWMYEYIGHTRETGSDALAPFGMDWVDSWQNWWDEGDF
jgi:hypothetical protein